MPDNQPKKPSRKPSKPSSKKRPLTERQKRLAANLANPKTKSVREAALNAGYSLSYARSHITDTTSNLSFQDAIEARIKRSLKNSRVTPEEIIGSAAFQMRSSVADVIDENGEFDIDKARENGVIDLVKELDVIRRDVKDDKGRVIETITAHKVKMMTSETARKELAGYVGLNNAPIVSAGVETPQEKAYNLFSRLSKKGWPLDRIMIGLKQYYPDVDILDAQGFHSDIIDVEATEPTEVE